MVSKADAYRQLPSRPRNAHLDALILDSSGKVTWMRRFLLALLKRLVGVLQALQNLLLERRGSGQIGRPHEFFRLGVQHYVAARQAMLAGYPGAASLFHQAFELLLKADLLAPLYAQHGPGWAPGNPQQARDLAVASYSKDADRLLRVSLGHNLWRTWRRFKALPNHPSGLSRLDQVVRSLSSWWELRYPGFPTSEALNFQMSIVKTPPVQSSGTQRVRTYQLCLEEMDELFAAIVEVDWTIHAIQMAIRGHTSGQITGEQMYRDRNNHVLW